MGHYQKVDGAFEVSHDVSKEAILKLRELLKPNLKYEIYNDEENETYSDFMYLELFRYEIHWLGGLFGKSSLSHNTINHLIKLMKEDFPDFSLTGSMRVYDMTKFNHFDIDMIDNVAVKVPLEMVRKGSVCKHCEKEI